MSTNNKIYMDSCTPYNSIDVIDAWGLNFCLGNVVEFVSRASKETGSEKLSDLNTALYYLNYEINKLQGQEPIEVPILTSDETAKKTQPKEK